MNRTEAQREDDLNAYASREAYRIVEVGADGQLRTLFHGLPCASRGRRSRVLAPGVWYEAEPRLVVDGGGQTPYLSGFNVLLDRAAMLQYLSRFRAPRTLRIARCEVRGLRQKPANPEVFLAEWLKVVEVEA